MKRLIFLLALLPLMLSGCSKENSSHNAGNTPVSFATTISGAHATPRASGAQWDTNDAIGVFMLNTGGAMPGDIVGNGTPAAANNVKYTTDGTNFITATPIYYPLSGNVDFVAYYPYQSTLTGNTYKVDVSNQTTPTTIDLLYAIKTNVAKSSTAVALQFDHKLSHVVINIKAGIGMTNADLAGITMKIAGMPTKANFDLADGTFGNPLNTAAITPCTVTADSKYEAIVIPQASNIYTGRKMIFTVGTDVYECPIPNADDFVSGKSYAYTVTVKKMGVSVSRGSITDWTGTGSSEDVVAKQLPIPMVFIPKGTFLMGSPTTEPNRASNETQHSVTLTKDYYMSKYQVTFAQYDAFCDATKRSKPDDSGWGRGDRPVTSVTWADALAYCEWLSRVTGGTWRLPTEAEWEYACRGDYTNKATEAATQPFGIGDGTKFDYTSGNFHWKFSYTLPGGEYEDDSKFHPTKTIPVGSYPANNYGLYDMHGNVYEWCSDWYGSYSSNPVTDPTGNTTGTLRVLRGGAWNSAAQVCRSAARGSIIPSFNINFFGFRVVFAP